MVVMKFGGTSVADQAAIDAAMAFPFTVVGQVWTYDTAAKLGIIDLTGSRVLTVKALTATEATIHVKDVTIKPAMAGGGEQVTEQDVVIAKTAADPYFAILASLNKLDTVTPGTPAYTAKTDTATSAKRKPASAATPAPSEANQSTAPSTRPLSSSTWPMYCAEKPQMAAADTSPLVVMGA